MAGMAGAVLAIALAVAVSPLMPIGAARLAEPDPGVSADWLVLALGAVAIVRVVVARAAWPAWRLAVRCAGGRRPGGERAGARLPGGRVAGRAGRPGHHDGRGTARGRAGPGRTAVPVRGALVGTTLSVLAVTAAFTFGANLLNLVHTPGCTGRPGTPRSTFSSGSSPGPGPAAVRHQPRCRRLDVTAITGSSGSAVQLIPAIGLAPGRGPLVSPTLLAGRAPRTSQRDRAGHIHAAPVSGCMSGSRCR